MLSSGDDRTYIYSSLGVNLPAPVQAYGQDEVQAAGGVSCRSSVGGSGPYIDAGVVGSNDLIGRQTTTAYARVVVPIGRAPARVDCTQLYNLEIQRLRMELQLARMNMPPEEGQPLTPAPAANVARPRPIGARAAAVAAAPPAPPELEPAASATTVGAPVTWRAPETVSLRGSLDAE